MRHVATFLLYAAALLAIAASVGMNWTFWTAQGVDVATSRVLGSVSVMVDVFKATLPMAIAWAWAERRRVASSIALVLFSVCLTFSMVSAIGFATWLRGAASGNREAASFRYKEATSQLNYVNATLGTLPYFRPSAVVGEALDRAKRDKRWLASHECTAVNLSSRGFCATFANLHGEWTSSIEREKLQARRAVLRGEIDQLARSGASLDNDLQAGILARLSGLDLSRVQNMLVLLVAVVVELGAGFGLLMAQVPLGNRRQAAQDPTLRPRQPMTLTLAPSQRPAPTRLIRTASGQLMIE